MSPAWLLDILTALILVVAAVSAVRLATAGLPTNRLSVVGRTGSFLSANGPCRADTDIAHLLMGIAMAGMLVPSVKTLPPYAWETIFGLLTVWFAWSLVDETTTNGPRSLVCAHRATHLLHGAAMVYMFAARTRSDGVSICAADGDIARPFTYATPARAFAVVLVCYSVWDIVGQLSSRRYSLGGTTLAGVIPEGGTAPTVACRFVMGVTMAFMLIYPMP
jgi:hypothetical protein